MNAHGASRLLVVDDDPDVAYSFTRVFRPPEYEVIEARSGEQAMQMLRSSKPDVILMDVRMPGAGGLGTLSKMQRDGVKIPVVLMTAYGSLRIASQAVQAGAFDCIMKPFDVSRIRQVVASALEAARRERKPVEQKASATAGEFGSAEARVQVAGTVGDAPIAGDAVFDLLFDEIARRQPLEEGMDAFDVVERHLIGRALKSCKGNQSQASKFLGITRNTLRKRIQKYGFAAGRDADDSDDE